MYEQIGSSTITTRCPNEIRVWSKEHNVKIPRILWAGYKRLSGQERDPVEGITAQVSALSEKLSRYAKKVWELEQALEDKEHGTKK
jgi:hypothetical protein